MYPLISSKDNYSSFRVRKQKHTVVGGLTLHTELVGKLGDSPDHLVAKARVLTLSGILYLWTQGLFNC